MRTCLCCGRVAEDVTVYSEWAEYLVQCADQVACEARRKVLRMLEKKDEEFRRLIDIINAYDDDACYPANACVTHGRCWTHSKRA